MPNPKIKQITLPSGNTYDIWDEDAHKLIYELESPGTYLGVTTSAITEGSSTNPITVEGQSVTASAGDWCITSTDKKAYIFSGSTSKWQEFTDMTNLGSLAYKDSAQGTVNDYVTAGSGSFTGTAATLKLTPAGSVSLTNANQSVTVSKTSGTATYTPEGSNASSNVTGSCSVTATGSVSTPTISVKTAGSTTTVNSITDVGTLPSATMPTYTVTNEVLTITAGSFSAGTLPTKGANTTVKTGDAAYQSSQPSFTGTAATGTISGTAAAQTFTGTGARLVTGNISIPSSASFTGTEGSISYTPAGSVGVTLTKGNKTITVS